ncbi:hypothetical protein B9Z65_4315 [Elsinoe australis]|uniref:Uncharacterized protein n=1 Tax=Elsinoe australis TaxID=40998 RepID=A0A2P7Z2H6_9PEZI|nr:hypothetical protein B9Z65_4315 [Elsinoe australis]
MPIQPPATFTATQLEAFYTRINLPTAHRHPPSDPSLADALSSPPTSLALLTALIRHSLAAIPFENLSLHYSPHHSIDISPSYLYDKIVNSPARGGYCMENNTLLLTVLRSLGFNVYPVGAKINESVGNDDPSVPTDHLKYSGWSHMVNLVCLPLEGGGEGLFLCDVGFGAGGPSRPMRIIEGEMVVNMPGRPGAGEAKEGAQVVRLTRERLGQTTRGQNSENELWVYSRRTGEGDFRPFYAFTEQEFFPEDFAVMNHWTSTSRSSWFTYRVVCLRKILDEDGTEVVGEVALSGNGLKKRIYGDVIETRVFQSEQERTHALKEYFGIELKDTEKQGIMGMPSMLKNDLL